MEIDVTKPVENPELSAMLKKRSQLSNDDVQGFVNCMNEIAREVAVNAHFLVVMNMDENDIEYKEDNQAVFKKDSKIAIGSLSSEDGKHFLPVFTDWNELRKWEIYAEGHVQTMIFSFDDLYTIVTKSGDDGIVINPFSDNVVFSISNLERMKQMKDIEENGYSTQEVKKDTKVLIGEPADYPHELVEAVKNYAKSSKSIKAIWLKLMVKDNEQSYLLIVDYDGDQSEVFKGISNVAVSHLKNGKFVDLVPFNDDFGRNAATGEPFYKKKRFLFW